MAYWKTSPGGCGSATADCGSPVYVSFSDVVAGSQCVECSYFNSVSFVVPQESGCYGGLNSLLPCFRLTNGGFDREDAIRPLCSPSSPSTSNFYIPGPRWDGSFEDVPNSGGNTLIDCPPYGSGPPIANLFPKFFLLRTKDLPSCHPDGELVTPAQLWFLIRFDPINEQWGWKIDAPPGLPQPLVFTPSDLVCQSSTNRGCQFDEATIEIEFKE